jgi:hydroxycarboxylate dehydrogenase B
VVRPEAVAAAPARVLPGPLQAFVRAVLAAMGAEPAAGEEVARHLVRSNLSGHDSHGVLRLARYVSQADAGTLVPSARPALVHERGPVAVFDVRRSFGHYAAAQALGWAMGRAREHGLAAATLRRPTHIGRLGEYTERAAEAGLVGLVTVGWTGEGPGLAVPFGGSAPALGTNPWSMGLPGARGRRVVFDAATTVVAEGKVQVARDRGLLLAPGCIVAADGSATREPEEFYAGGALLPLGGEVAGHKGSGLALVSALVGALALGGDGTGGEGTGGVAGGGPAGRQVGGALVLAIEPGWFGDAEAYRALVADAVEAVKRTPPAPGVREVLVAGEPEERSRELRSRVGIPMPEGTWRALSGVAERFAVPLPQGVEA